MCPFFLSCGSRLSLRALSFGLVVLELNRAKPCKDKTAPQFQYFWPRCSMCSLPLSFTKVNQVEQTQDLLCFVWLWCCSLLSASFGLVVNKPRKAEPQPTENPATMEHQLLLLVVLVVLLCCANQVRPKQPQVRISWKCDIFCHRSLEQSCSKQSDAEDKSLFLCGMVPSAFPFFFLRWQFWS